MDRFQLDRLKARSNSWLGKAWVVVLATVLMSMAVLPSQQNRAATPSETQTGPETQSGNEPRQSSFPGIGTKSVQAPVEPGKTPASKVAVEAESEKGSEAILYETTAEVGLRSIPNLELPPVIEARLPKGTLLWLLVKEEGTDFTRVSVLGGFQGFVFAKYCRLDGDGMVEVTGTGLAFRAQPTTKGWPIDKLRKGTRLPLLSREGDWFKVLSNAEVGALVPDSKIQKVTSISIKPGGELASFVAGSALLKRADQQYVARQASWTKVRGKQIADAKRQRSIAVVQQEVRDLQAKMSRERERADQDPMDLSGIPPLLAGIRKHVEAIEPTDPGLVGSLATVEAEYEGLIVLAHARRIRDEPLPKPNPLPPRVDLAKRGFLQSGWVRYRPGAYSSFQLVKGGEVLCYLVCDSRRYNLKDYVGCELGVKGKVGPREGADFKVLDVSRLNVLSSR